MNKLEPQGLLMVCSNLSFLEDLCRKNLDYPESSILIINEDQEIITAVSSVILVAVGGGGGDPSALFERAGRRTYS